MKIGFTGTRNGMSPMQLSCVRAIIQMHATDRRHIIVTGAHGGCVGADAEFHSICMEYEIDRIIHPGYSTKDRDSKKFSADLFIGRRDVVLSPLPFLARNREIVETTDFMIACPESPLPSTGGTWYTVNYARDLKRNIIVIHS